MLFFFKLIFLRFLVQITYAALDAHVLLEIFWALKAHAEKEGVTSTFDELAGSLIRNKNKVLFFFLWWLFWVQSPDGNLKTLQAKQILLESMEWNMEHVLYNDEMSRRDSIFYSIK